MYIKIIFLVGDLLLIPFTAPGCSPVFRILNHLGCSVNQSAPGLPVSFLRIPIFPHIHSSQFNPSGNPLEQMQMKLSLFSLMNWSTFSIVTLLLTASGSTITIFSLIVPNHPVDDSLYTHIFCSFPFIILPSFTHNKSIVSFSYCCLLKLKRSFSIPLKFQSGPQG